MRAACAEQGGVEVDTQGDAFFFAFPTAPGALAAASAMTRALAPGPIQVRIGLHTGRPRVTDEGYVGKEVHFAARVAATGHGGQIVLSKATADLVEADLAELGEHRLKDVPEAVAIYQLGSGSFPPLKTISNTNLPRPASSFVGREGELADVLAKIEKGARLITLTGPGGSGKTRLALEAAASLVPEYKAGVFWVGLAALRDSALVAETISQTLGAKDGLAEHIGEREMLLLLDNLEQVIEAAPELSVLLAACPNLSMLVTSRELLRVQGEVEYPVPPLASPEAIALFCERAQLEPSEEIAELCVRLDNLPLAVELAAARAKALTPAQILERLSQRLDLLKGGRDADPRQQTLRATIEWSHQLLSEAEQRLFARLSVFAGGCTLEAAEEVCEADLDTLQSLVEKSLLRFSECRYWMLETIREYARSRLTDGDHNHLARRHAARHARIAVELYPALRAYEDQALRQMREERENMRQALAFAFEHGEALLAEKLMFGLWFVWLTSASGHEARLAADRWLASPARRSLSPIDRFGGDLAAAEILRFTGDPNTAAELKREQVRTARASPDALVHGIEVMRFVAGTLSDLATIETEAGRFSEARSYGEEALALRLEVGLPGGIAHALQALGEVAYAEGDYHRAIELYEDAAARFERAGSSLDAVASGLSVAACELLLGRLDEASARITGALDSGEDAADDLFVVHVLRLAAMLAGMLGRLEVCAAVAGAADRRVDESGLAAFGAKEEASYRSVLADAREVLGERAFVSSYERGRSLTTREVFDLARTVQAASR